MRAPAQRTRGAWHASKLIEESFRGAEALQFQRS